MADAILSFFIRGSILWKFDNHFMTREFGTSSNIEVQSLNSLKNHVNYDTVNVEIYT